MQCDILMFPTSHFVVSKKDTYANMQMSELIMTLTMTSLFISLVMCTDLMHSTGLKEEDSRKVDTCITDKSRMISQSEVGLYDNNFVPCFVKVCGHCWKFSETIF